MLLGAAGPACGAGETGIYFGDLGQAIAAMLIFAVLLLVLRKWVWRPLVAQLQHREDAVAKTLEGADKRRREAEATLDEYKQRLAQAEAEAKELLDDARRRVDQERERILAEARQEAKRFAESALQDVEQAGRQAMDDLRTMTADIAVELAGRIVRRSLTPEDHQRLVQESLEEIRKHVAEGGK